MPWPRALRSLRHRDLRLLFAGQLVSLVGTWMQSVAQGWLVYRLTRSSQLLGLVGFAAQLPVFLLAVWAGSLADRLPRRRIVLATQLNATLQATLLAALTLTGAVRPWMLVALSAVLGLSTAFELPARQALVAQLAGEDMPNAVALNSSIVNLTRVVGPALAGWVVAAVGEGACFALNALSFAGTLYAVLVMRAAPQPAPAASGREHLVEGIAYAWRTPHVRALLLLTGACSFFALPYATLLPVIARDVLHGDARLLGTLQASAGVGALMGAVALLGRQGLPGLGRIVATGATLLAAGVAVLALSHRAPLSCAGLMLAGLGYIVQTAGCLTLLQGLAPDAMRGRLMGLFSMVFVGTTPFGALAAGAAGERWGVPHVLLAGAGVVLAASLAFHAAIPGLRRDARARFPTHFPPQEG